MRTSTLCAWVAWAYSTFQSIWHDEQPLHGGMPTDRLVIQWNLNSPQVELALNGKQRERSADAVAIEIPPASSDVPIGARLAGQARLRSELIRLLRDGYVITGFEGHEKAASYILEKLKVGFRRNYEN